MSSTGVEVRGCCGATNLCECARHRYVRETTRVLVNDAASAPPTIFVVLTAREYLRKDESMRRTLAQLVKSARRRWPEYQHFVRWEDQARGALHANLLVKGVPADQFEELRRVLVDVWCSRVDADPKGQYAEPCAEGRAVAGYVARKVEHAGKRDQEPELARGKHRTSQTRGYFGEPMAELRARARRELQYEALRWRGQSHELAEHELQERERATWRLVHRDASTLREPNEVGRRELDHLPVATDRRELVERPGRRDLDDAAAVGAEEAPRPAARLALELALPERQTEALAVGVATAVHAGSLIGTEDEP